MSSDSPVEGAVFVPTDDHATRMVPSQPPPNRPAHSWTATDLIPLRA